MLLHANGTYHSCVCCQRQLVRSGAYVQLPLIPWSQCTAPPVAVLVAQARTPCTAKLYMCSSGLQRTARTVHPDAGIRRTWTFLRSWRRYRNTPQARFRCQRLQPTANKVRGRGDSGSWPRQAAPNVTPGWCSVCDGRVGSCRMMHAHEPPRAHYRMHTVPRGNCNVPRALQADELILAPLLPLLPTPPPRPPPPPSPWSSVLCGCSRPRLRHGLSAGQRPVLDQRE